MRALKYQCTRCEKSYDKEDSLRKHVGRKHKVKSKDFYIELKLDGVRPTCNCGCNTPTRYYDWTRGFSKFAPGHQSRVQNSMQGRRHSKEAKQRISLANTGNTSWAKGLTKDTDQRIARLGQRVAESWTDEKRGAYSERMRKNRLNGTVRTLRGPDHSQWKGGTSSISARLGSYLYGAWTYPKLKAVSFTCDECGSTSDLEVHHDGERKADIVRQCRNELFPDVDYELGWDEETQVVEAVVRYHVDNEVSGRVLCKSCHVDVHDVLGETYNF